MKFLVDECVTTDLVLLAQNEGHEAYHVVHVGKAGWQDWNVTNYALENDQILVTNNAKDFRKLYASSELHPGLVILLPSVGREAQQELFRAALNHLAQAGDPLNKVLEVAFDGEDVTIHFYDLLA